MGEGYHPRMLSRERLWQRASGRPFWMLPWLLVAACSLPWVLPERWEGGLPSGSVLLVGALLLLASLPLLFRRRWAGIPLGLMLLAYLAMSLASHAREERALPVGLTALEGRIGEPWTPRGAWQVTELDLNSPVALKGQRVELRIPVQAEAPLPHPGTPFRVRAELRSTDPGPIFLAERPLWRARSDRAVRSALLHSASQLEILGPPAPDPLLRFRSWVRGRFEGLGLEGARRDLWGALVLGLPPAQDDVFSPFAESGTIHTLIVSGLQVTLIMAAVEALVRRLFRRGGSVTAVLAGLLYATLVGFSAPVWRGLLMGMAWALGRGTGWKVPPVLTLHGALLLWMLFHPAAGCDPGFLLAWAALLGLIWGAEPLAGLFSPLLGRWALPFGRIAAPWFSTLPLLALFHGGAPLWGIAANLLVLPIVAFLTPLCLLLTLLPIPALITAAAWLLGWMGLEAVPFFARVLPLGTAQLWPWIGLALGWLILAQRQAHFLRNRGGTLALVGVSLGLLLSGGIGRAPSTLSLEAIDIGQGDALLLRVPGGEATLVDTGPSPWAARRIARVLSRRGVREPLHVLLTHPHGDHVGGYSTLGRLRPVASLAVPMLGHPEEDWVGLGASNLGFPGRGVLRGEAWTRGSAHFEALWPPSPLVLSDMNMASLVLRVRWEDRELWLMGDAGEVQERDLMELGEPTTQAGHRVLKLGHHGSAGASSRPWLEALRPEFALITAGRNNRFGFPADRVQQDLRELQIPHGIVGASWGLRLQALPGGWVWQDGQGQRGWIPFVAK